MLSTMERSMLAKVQGEEALLILFNTEIEES